MPDPTPDQVTADRLAAMQLRASNVQECPQDAPDALWRSVHGRSAQDVRPLLAAVEAVLALAGEWDVAAALLADEVERVSPRNQARRVLLEVRSELRRINAQAIREAISRALLGKDAGT